MNNTIAMRRFEIVVGIEQLEQLTEILGDVVRGYGAEECRRIGIAWRAGSGDV